MCNLIPYVLLCLAFLSTQQYVYEIHQYHRVFIFVATYYYIVWIPHRLPTLLLENYTHLGGKLIALLQGMWTSLVAQTRKESACNMCSIPGLGRSPGEGNSYPVQYSCLENSMDRGAWQATVHGVTKSHTRLSDFHSLSGHVTGSRISGSSGRHMTRFSG